MYPDPVTQKSDILYGCPLTRFVYLQLIQLYFVENENCQVFSFHIIPKSSSMIESANIFTCIILCIIIIVALKNLTFSPDQLPFKVDAKTNIWIGKKSDSPLFLRHHLSLKSLKFETPQKLGAQCYLLRVQRRLRKSPECCCCRVRTTAPLCTRIRLRLA